MLFVADQIPNELKRIVEFLNEQMDPAEVLALELRQFEGEGLKTLVPIVYGQTQEAQQNKGSGAPKRSWDFASICAELERNSGPEAVRVAEKIYGWMQRVAKVDFGKGATQGSIRAIFGHGAGSFCPVELSTDGKIWINFNYMKKPFDTAERRRELLDQINEIDGVNIPPESVTNGHPTIPLSSLLDDQQFVKFLSAMDWFVEELRRA